MINQKIRELRIEGFSIREISKKIDRPYSTVQRACKSVTMLNKGKNRYTSKVKGIIKEINIKKGLNKEKVRIMSNLLFDGAVYISNYHYSIMYVNSSKELITEFIEDMTKTYNVKPSSLEHYDNYIRVKFLSKLIYYDLMSYMNSFSTSDENCSIPANIIGKGSFKTIILRAFWENEGSIAKDGKLSADLKSYKVINQLSKLHTDLGLKHYISRYDKNGWAYKLILNRNKDNYARFIKQELFSKSRVCKGYFKGRTKISVLKDYFKRKFNN